jgi:hypothetical protein
LLPGNLIEPNKCIHCKLAYPEHHGYFVDFCYFSYRSSDDLCKGMTWNARNVHLHTGAFFVDSKMRGKDTRQFLVSQKRRENNEPCSLIPKWRHVEDLETANDGGPVHRTKK